MGKTTSHDLQTVFGRPERVRVVNDEEEYWVYIDYQSEEWDNFSTDFLIDKKNGILKSVTWKPLSNDQFAKAENVLTSFKNMRFIPQRNPKMPEININFAESGEISFAELTKMKRVIFITLGVPNHLSLKAETALNSI